MRSAWLAVAGVVAIISAMLVGPFLAPEQFSWIRHTTSEQAGQQVSGAWMMRTGFAAYGASIALSAWMRRANRSWVRGALLMFGLGLVGTAIWSNASIVQGVNSNMAEDRLHSIASGVVGFSFASACAASLFAPGGYRKDALAWFGLWVSVMIPLAMAEFPDVRGVLQRGMFVLSFVFVLREFASRPTVSRPEAGAR